MAKPQWCRNCNGNRSSQAFINVDSGKGHKCGMSFVQMTKEPYCKPLYHRTLNAAPCHLHSNNPSATTPWHGCPVHGHQAAAASSCDERVSSDGEIHRFSADSSCCQPESNKDLKKACEKLCEQIQWKSEKHYQEVARSSFLEIVQCQATLRALHKESVESNLLSHELLHICEDSNPLQNSNFITKIYLN